MTTVLPTPYQQYIHVSRYSRWMDDQKRRETWDETVDRYCNFFNRKFEGKFEDTFLNVLKPAILNLEVVPSMRALMTAGPALERDHIAGYNCSYLAVDNKRAFSEALYILLNGTGLGFSCERQEIAGLPRVPEVIKHSDDTIVVADSKLGWAKALKKMISSLYEGDIPNVDYSKVRPAGARLKTFGGRASGPQPLQELFQFLVVVFQQAAGRKLNSLEVHDIMCKIGEVVVVGGVRRSALISLSNLSDTRMRDAKSGQWWIDNPQRALSNNSVAYTETPSVEVFMDEWLSLIKSKAGERGLFNRVAAQKQAAKWGRRADNFNYGCNPCCFTGDMMLTTSLGKESFLSLAGKSSLILSSDGTYNEGTVWSSGVKDIVQVKFLQRRNSIKCTPDHIFQLNDGTECRADLLKGKRVKAFYQIKDTFDRESFFAGFIQGDGNTGRLSSSSHLGLEVNLGEKDLEVAEFLGLIITDRTCYSVEAYEVATKYQLSPNPLPTRALPISTPGNFLTGLYSANGCVIKESRVALKTTCRELSLQLVEILKRDYDISAYITTNKPTSITFANGEYLCKESYDINIGQYSDLIKFAENISFLQQYKRDALDRMLVTRAPMVSKVTKLGKQEVFDFTEPKNHWGVVEGVIVHNSEIILRNREFCNLTEVIIRSTDTLETLKEKVRLATILGTFQSTLTNFSFVSEEYKQNCEEERLLGVSFTGIMDHVTLSGQEGFDKAKLWLNELRDYARTVNKEWAETLGINESAAITCVKPSGTVSQLADTASGAHTRYSDYYLRTVRNDKKDPLYKFMKDQGVYVEDDVTKPESTGVFYFPVKSPEDCMTNNDLTAIQQLELWLLYQREWCEHKPSITVFVGDKEWLEVGAWVYKHFDEVSGVSFLPKSNHSYRQAPYQEITEAQYNDWVEKHPLPEIDWSGLSEYEKEDMTVASQTLACVSGYCEI